MKYPCDLVKDLLPLYHDDVCSSSAKEIVEQHLPECPSCSEEMQKMNDNTYDMPLHTEREGVVKRHMQSTKRKSLLAGLCLSGVLMIPVLVCLIVNLAVGQALDWFFVVLTSLMLFASLTVLPLMVEEKKGLYTLGGFTGSLLLLLATCCLYTGGNWFFVAAISVLFGLSVVFLPFVLYALPLKGFAARHKGLIVMAADTLLLFGIIVSSGLYIGAGGDYWRLAFSDATLNVAFAWVLFATIRYLKVSGLIRAGICCIVSGVYISLLHDIIEWIAGGITDVTLLQANFSVWNNSTINPNVYALIFLSGCTVGLALITAGIIRTLHKKPIITQ